MQRADSQSVFRRHPKSGVVECFQKIFGTDPFPVEKTSAQGVFLHGNHDAAHREIAENDQRRKRRKNHQLQYKLLRIEKSQDPLPDGFPFLGCIVTCRISSPSP